jgi:hypothetical protein
MIAPSLDLNQLESIELKRTWVLIDRLAEIVYIRQSE